VNEQLILQWLPGILIVAVVAFPAFFFMKRNVVIRLVVACVSIVAVLLLFGAVMGHQFTFTRREDLPPLFIGVGLGWLLSAGARALRAELSRRQSL